MVIDIALLRPDLEALCRRFGVRRLDLFGSAASGRFDPARSDVDVLVDLGERDSASYVEAYFGLLEALEELFGRPVDLVTERSVTNPYLMAGIRKSRVPLYAA